MNDSDRLNLATDIINGFLELKGIFVPWELRDKIDEFFDLRFCPYCRKWKTSDSFGLFISTGKFKKRCLTCCDKVNARQNKGNKKQWHKTQTNPKNQKS